MQGKKKSIKQASQIPYLEPELLNILTSGEHLLPCFPRMQCPVQKQTHHQACIILRVFWSQCKYQLSENWYLHRNTRGLLQCYQKKYAFFVDNITLYCLLTPRMGVLVFFFFFFVHQRYTIKVAVTVIFWVDLSSGTGWL